MVLQPPFPADRDALAAPDASHSRHVQRIHGLTIASGTRLPGLASASLAESRDAEIHFDVRDEPPQPTPPSARIRYRSMGPGTSSDATLVVYEFAEGHTAFRYADGTAFDIIERPGAIDIIVVIGTGQTVEDMAVYLYGPVLGFVLRRLGRLALHASCVALHQFAAAFVGSSGAGKSTTAAALALHGHTLVSDDLVALEREGDVWCAHPAFDHLRVWSSSEPLLYGRLGVLDRITPGWEKLRVPLPDRLAERAVRVGVIYLLEWDEGATQPYVTPVSGTEAVLALASHSYSNYLLTPEQKATELAQLGDLASRVPIRRLVRARTALAHDALCAVVAQDIVARAGSE